MGDELGSVMGGGEQPAASQCLSRAHTAQPTLLVFKNPTDNPLSSPAPGVPDELETDPAETKQATVCPPVLPSGMERTLPVCHPRSLSDEGYRVALLPALCLHKVGSLDSLVINTLCLNLGLHGNIFVPKGV